MLKVRVVGGLSVDGKPLIVGLPGMGGVAYATANFFITSAKARLVAEFYHYSYPPQLGVSGGKAYLIKAYLYDAPSFLVLTANAQPSTAEAQNEFCDKVLELLKNKGVSKVISTAAYVVDQVGSVRAVYIAGNDDNLISEFLSLGAQQLSSGVVSGVNGAIVGWASYYDIPAAVLLAETWEPIVQADDIDYRAAKYLVSIISKYLGMEVDTSILDHMANQVEGKVLELMKKSFKELRIKKGFENVM